MDRELENEELPRWVFINVQVGAIYRGIFKLTVYNRGTGRYPLNFFVYFGANYSFHRRLYLAYLVTMYGGRMEISNRITFQTRGARGWGLGVR